MSVGKVIETLETEIREYKRMIDERTLCLADESIYGELQSRIDFDREIIALLREYQTLQTSATSARLAAIKDIPTERLIELAVAEAAGLIAISPSAAERAHQDAQHNEPLTLEELREMYEPVWVSVPRLKNGGYWCLCNGGTIIPQSCQEFDARDIKHWVFYRRPPKEATP